MTLRRLGHHGFTLVEILIVILLFGLFIEAAYSLYLAHMKTAIVQEDVLDTQQNLRIAMNAISRDIAMGGFLASSPLNTSAAFVNHSSVIHLATATDEKAYVRVSSISPINPLIYTVIPSESLRRFKSNDTVRCVTIEGDSQGAGSLLTVDNVNPETGIITLRALSPTSIPPNIGDVICKIIPPDPLPSTYDFETVTYSVRTGLADCGTGVKCIVREVNLDPATGKAAKQEIVAQIGSDSPMDLGQLRFQYLLDDGRELKSGIDADAAADLRAVRVAITGQTIKKGAPGDSAKTRRISSLIRLRNRNGAP